MQGFTVANVSAFINWMGAQPSKYVDLNILGKNRVRDKSC